LAPANSAYSELSELRYIEEGWFNNVLANASFAIIRMSESGGYLTEGGVCDMKV
jgi:hypothetical protein